MASINNNINNCAMCRSKILNKDYLNCSMCKRRFDTICAKVSEKRFSMMDSNRKNSWKCSDCTNKLVKIDPGSVSSKAGGELDLVSTPRSSNNILSVSTPSHDNVTTRNKSYRPTDHNTIAHSNSKSPAQFLSKEDIRELFREEFAAMRQSLLEELRQGLKDMVKEELQVLRNDVCSIEESVKYMNEEHEDIKKSYRIQLETIHELQKENAQLMATIHDYSTRLQIMEQTSRSCNLEIQCIPDNKNENLLTTITQLSRVVSCEIKENDIHHCTRVAKINKQDSRPRTIIVKLATPRLRDMFLAKVITYNKRNPNDKLNTSHIGIGGHKQPIFILEHLSQANRKLHAAARTKAKENGYKFVWVKQGRIFMRKTETSEFIYIKDYNVLEKLK